MKEAMAKRREKPRAEKEKSGAEPQDVEMKEEDQRAPREQDQLTLDGLDNTHIYIFIIIYISHDTSRRSAGVYGSNHTDIF